MHRIALTAALLTACGSDHTWHDVATADTAAPAANLPDGSDGGGEVPADSDLPEAGVGGPEGGSCWQAELVPDLEPHPANHDWPDPAADITCTDDTLQMASNGIPAFEFVDLTPNGLSALDYRFEVPLHPEVAAEPSEIPLLGTTGFLLNGIPAFGPNEAAFPDPYGDPVFNGITDFCLGHTGAGGAYHFHAILESCVLGRSVDLAEPSPILGFANDGFPIYGPRGCVDAACTEVVELESGWVRTGDPTTYAWDAHEYVGDEDDPMVLDACNGRVQPDGTYGYHVTLDFPYILGCYAGTSMAQGGDAGGGPGDGGGPPGP